MCVGERGGGAEGGKDAECVVREAYVGVGESCVCGGSVCVRVWLGEHMLGVEGNMCVWMRDLVCVWMGSLWVDEGNCV